MKIENSYGYDNVLPYKAYIPDNPGEKPAIIVQLHGVGERGNGGDELEKVASLGLPNVVNDENLKNCILVCPQCPIDSFWVAKIETIRKFIDTVVEKYNVDTDRIYLVGLSMGGYGTWYTAQAYPKFFAAIAPCCGGGMVWYADILLKTPIWAFHGSEDTIVPLSETMDMVNRLKGRNEKLKYDIFEGVGHNAADYGFTPKLIEWLLEQHK